MKTEIVIIDDHTLISNALKGIIDDFQNFHVLYECENGMVFQEKIKLYGIPKIVLLDISMPVMNGFETAKWIKENYPEIQILALSMQNDEQSVIKMVKNGANGYLLKNTSPKELEKALNSLINEGCYYPDWASRLVFSAMNKYNSEKISITEREKEFLRYNVTEMSYKEIADKMCCSPRTIESYRDSLCEKLELKTRVGLAVFAMKNGYVD